MTEIMIPEVINNLKLNDNQKTAVMVRGKDVIVTAGAGSGKTSTLVGRYISLLLEGVSPRKIAAITFTKKAAMEMRSRIRSKLILMQQESLSQVDRNKLEDLTSQMDSARIGTIHSLCTEILRNHPAEAGVDPRFQVLDEGISMVLRKQALEETINKIVENEFFIPLFKNITIKNISKIFEEMLEKRLEVSESFSNNLINEQILLKELRERVFSSSTGGLIDILRGMNREQIIMDAGEKLSLMVDDLLMNWSQAEKAINQNDPVQSAIYLFDIRRNNLDRRSGKKDSIVKARIAELQINFDKIINPLTGGKNKEKKPSKEIESIYESVAPLLKEAFNLIISTYCNILEKRQALDFDDLEFYAQQLLKQEEIRIHWQGELNAILVDEYQDTNQRQREIVNALAGSRGCLFIVGDMRQSIYRFRKADVTVFRKEQERIKLSGGESLELNVTYRSHEKLLNTMGFMLSEVIGTKEDPSRDYYVPYTPLVAAKNEPPADLLPPFVEFIFGAGSDVESARPIAAQALVARLQLLMKEKQISKWDDVALLFRASTGFFLYEEALENAGIPFVTVSGRGFYDRPEIRDLLNIIRTLTDLSDDLSFAGLLRSPSFGLSDAALMQLRQQGIPYWKAIQSEISCLDKEDQIAAERVVMIIKSILPLVDRIPVAELIKQVVDTLDYRSILATADVKIRDTKSRNAGGRLWRNLDKLIEDASVSQQLTVRDFLNSLETLNNAGAREGEASAETDGAVRLMTIHKAKGLEFEVVVLADSGREVRSPSELVYFSTNMGVSIKLKNPHMLYNLQKEVNKDQDNCEAFRLLYVALTRAKSRLIISGHGNINLEGKFKLAAWAKELDKAADKPSDKYLEMQGKYFDVQIGSGFQIRASCEMDEIIPTPIPDPQINQKIQFLNVEPILYKPLLENKYYVEDNYEKNRVFYWTATQQRNNIPGEIIGTIVHHALQRWIFPDSPNWPMFLKKALINAGIANELIIFEAESIISELLSRLKNHFVFKEINFAKEKYSELTYQEKVEEYFETKRIDLLYKVKKDWYLVDFKTDHITNTEQKRLKVLEHTNQILTYRTAVKHLLNIDAAPRLCYLDDQRAVTLYEVPVT